jgi:hypothetical protein
VINKIDSRSALNNGNSGEAFKILDDLEYVAQNLESPKRSNKVGKIVQEVQQVGKIAQEVQQGW